ncbi:MAG: O-methyltransferase [Bacilli bacterium]
MKLINIINNSYIINMRKYAVEHNVPIVRDEGLELLYNTIQSKQITKILEIGTAIGYSASCMALMNPNICVHTIERNDQMYKSARENIEILKLDSKIKVFHADALLLDEKTIDDDYDMIFIDAAKAQYIKFFDKFTKHLKIGGVVVSDNLLFHGFVNGDQQIMSKNVRGLVRKIKNYREYLQENLEYKTEFFDLGDGMSISIKKENKN